MLLIPADKHERYEALSELLRFNLPHIGLGVEVGVKYGETASYLLEQHSKLWLYLVDSYPAYKGIYETYTAEQQEKIKAEAVKNLEKYSNRITWMYKDSSEASQFLYREFFDFVYIDAAHDYKSVKLDVMNWYFSVRKGGILCGHDYCYGPVQDAVRDCVADIATIKKSAIGIYTVPCDGDIWAIERI